LLAVFIIHANLSYPTSPSYIPDPFSRVYTARIHKDKHGSDTGTYDTEGRFLPQKFEDVFAKYADGRDYLTFWDLPDLLKGQRCIGDLFGWFGEFLECMFYSFSPSLSLFFRSGLLFIYFYCRWDFISVTVTDEYL
jgi:peroxygenase